MASLGVGFEPNESFLYPNCIQRLLNDGFNLNCSFLTIPLVLLDTLPNNSTDSILLDQSVIELAQWQRNLSATSDRSLKSSTDWSNRILFTVKAAVGSSDREFMRSLEFISHLGCFAVLIDEFGEGEIEEVSGLLKKVRERNFGFNIYVRIRADSWNTWYQLVKATGDFFYPVVDFDTVFDNDILQLWSAEPIKAIMFSSENNFRLNPKGFPVLPRSLKEWLFDLFREDDIPIIINGTNIVDHVKYIKWLHSESKKAVEGSPRTSLTAFTHGFQNVLQTPLQPLSDHLPSETYEVFEQDPIKYRLYREAIEAALKDQREVVGDDELKVAVVGAGRGPLVQEVLNASVNTGIDIAEIVIVEKNPSACLTLLDRFFNSKSREVNQSLPTLKLIHGDMRQLKSVTFDIIISELLGSFSDNELSPECLWPVESLLKPQTGVMIPQEYTSYLRPIYSPILRRQVKEIREFGEDPFGVGYVVYPTRFYSGLGESSRAVFTFKHPESLNKQSDQNSTINFKASDESVVDGLLGYFDCQLYKSVRMSTEPSTASPNMLSWFPIYFPLKDPLLLRIDDNLKVEFGRKREGNRIWYEWRVAIENPIQVDRNIVLSWQNLNGQSYSMKL